MSIATKCTCGHSSFCIDGVKECSQILRNTFIELCENNQVTIEESKKLRCFLFALRQSDKDLDMIEKIINKYNHLL